MLWTIEHRGNHRDQRSEGTSSSGRGPFVQHRHKVDILFSLLLHLSTHNYPVRKTSLDSSDRVCLYWFSNSLSPIADAARKNGRSLPVESGHSLHSLVVLISR